MATIKEVKRYLSKLSIKKVSRDPKKYREEWLDTFPDLKFRSLIKFQREVITYLETGKLTEIRKCKGCGKAFIGKVYCSKSCCTSDPKRNISISLSLTTRSPAEKEEAWDKYRKTNRERYGYDYPMQSPELRSIKDLTNFERYGHTSPLHSDSIKPKIEETMERKYGTKHNWNKGSSSRKKGIETLHEKYGVYHTMDSPEFREKVAKTNLERYGHPSFFGSEKGRKEIRGIMIERYGETNPMQVEEIRRKTESTNLERYGYTNPLSSPEIKEKIRQTNIEKYGAPHFLQSPEGKRLLSERLGSPEVQEKMYNTRSINNSFNSSFPEEEILYWLHLFYPEVKTQHKSKNYPYKCDFYIPSEDLYIEYQGTWVHGDEPYDKSNPEHKKIVKELKSKEGDFYRYALKVWTISDPEKRKIAKKNELNWLEFFDIESFLDWILRPLMVKERKVKKKYQSRLDLFLTKIGSNLSVNIANPFIDYRLEGDKIFIFEHEWKDKRTRMIWKSILRHKSGKSKPIYARKCYLEEVSSKEMQDFLENNHLQGSCRSKIRLGLYYEDRLVALMTFGKPRFNKRYDWELLRFCNLLGYHVVGGAGKLLKAFRKMYPGKIISYSNKRLGDGEMYRALGFTQANQSPPNYWYFHVLDKIPRNRLQFQKHKLEEKLPLYCKYMSEVENMVANGYLRFFDLGNITYILGD